MTPTARSIGVVDLGCRPYQEVLDLQRTLCRQRVARERGQDLLLLVEHDPVVTLGRGTRDTSLPIPVDILRARGIAVHEVERGGDVTVHGPGQLVGYPILDLEGYTPDLHWYLRTLEAVLIDVLAAVGVAGGRRDGLTGVWVEDRKIASIGVHVKQWVTLHGFALNVINDLALFDLVVPCGIPGVAMTSIARERADSHADSSLLGATRHHIVAAMGRCFSAEPFLLDAETLDVASL